MDGLRSINKRRRAFRAQPMKASRRKFALGGLAVNPYEATYDKTVSSISETPTTDDDTRTALSGDAPERTDIPRGSGAYYARGGRIAPGKGDRQHPSGKALGKVPALARGGWVSQFAAPTLEPGSLSKMFGGLRGKAPSGGVPNPAAATPAAPGADLSQQEVVPGLNPELGGQRRYTGPNPLWKRPNPGDLVPMKKGGKAGLRRYQEGGEVEDEDETKRLRRYGAAPMPVEEAAPASAIAPGLDPTSGVTVGQAAAAGLREPPPPSAAPGYQGQMEGLPALPDPQELRRRQSVARGGTGEVPPSAPGTFGVPPTGGGGMPSIMEADTGVRPLPPAPTQTPLEKAFGLRAGSKRTDVEGSPGVSKYRDATGKTLYSNVDYDVKGMAPTPEMVKEAQARAKADSERLTGLVAARAASGDPRDIEAARYLAVTPEQRLLVADAENVAGLRARARSGDRSALLELQGRQAAQLEGLRGQRALQVAQLGRMPTPLQLSQEARAERGEVRAATKEQRDANLKLINDTIDGNFTPDDRGKAEAADFRQNLTATMPHLKGVGGDLSKLDPNTLSILFSLNALRKNASPGTISQFFGADPSSKNLLDFVPKSTAASFWRTQIRTPQGVNTLGELAGGRKDLKDFIAKLLAQQGVGGG